MKKHTFFLILVTVLLYFGFPAVAVAYNPGDIQPTTALTVTIPALETGDLYDTLVSIAEPGINPIYDTANDYYTNYILPYNPVTMSTDAVNQISLLWQFMTYFSNLTPGLTSLIALITFFLVVILIKTVASVLMYIWKLIPFKAS